MLEQKDKIKKSTMITDMWRASGNRRVGDITILHYRSLRASGMRLLALNHLALHFIMNTHYVKIKGCAADLISCVNSVQCCRIIDIASILWQLLNNKTIVFKKCLLVSIFYVIGCVRTRKRSSHHFMDDETEVIKGNNLIILLKKWQVV